MVPFRDILGIACSAVDLAILSGSKVYKVLTTLAMTPRAFHRAKASSAEPGISTLKQYTATTLHCTVLEKSACLATYHVPVDVGSQQS